MTRALLLLVVLAACGPKAPSKPAPSCPAAPPVVTEAEMERMRACEDDACRDAIHPGFAKALIPVKVFFLNARQRLVDALAELSAIEERACACADAACAAQTQADVEAWIARYGEARGTESQAQQVGSTYVRITRCLEGKQ